MSQETVNFILAALVAVMPVITLLVQKFFSRRKDAADFGSDLLEVANSTAKSLREARDELVTLDTLIKTMETDHEREIDALRSEQNARIDRMKARIVELEKTIIRYEISFTLQTHPTVQVNDLKVVGKESVTDSQKMRAIIDSDPNNPVK